MLWAVRNLLCGLLCWACYASIAVPAYVVPAEHAGHDVHAVLSMLGPLCVITTVTSYWEGQWYYQVVTGGKCRRFYQRGNVWYYQLVSVAIIVGLSSSATPLNFQSACLLFIPKVHARDRMPPGPTVCLFSVF